MFGKKKQTVSFDEKIKAAKYERVFQSLKDIVKLEVVAQDKDGKSAIDYAATCSAIKTKARLAIDFVSDLDKNSDD